MWSTFVIADATVQRCNASIGYCIADGDAPLWTAQHAAVRRFPTREAAIRYAKEHRLDGIHIVEFSIRQDGHGVRPTMVVLDAF